jgi:N,N'-diacetylchitobiose transport system substrate-binding protein
MKKKFLAAAAVSLSAAMVLGACGGTGGQSSGGDKNEPLTIWVMKGDFSDPVIKAINEKFTKETGVQVKTQVQQWDNITTKITTALSTSTPPDVIDMGDTQVLGYAASGGLMDMSSHKSEFDNSSTWLSGLEEPATSGGKLYGVPSFGASRAVVYNKKMWADAGITEAPKTYEEFTGDLDKIAAQHASDPDFIPFYRPGKDWYAMLQYVWDAGGDLAKKDGDTWKGDLTSKESLEGLNEWKGFQNKYSSKASRTVDTVNPEQNDFFAQGKTAALFVNSSAIPAMAKINPAMTEDQMGTFPMPGKSGKNQPTLVAGSDWAVSAKSKHQDMALKWIKIATSDEIEQKWVFEHDGWLPNSQKGLDAALQSGSMKEAYRGFFEAAKSMKSTPASPQWTTIEGDQTIPNFSKDVVAGDASVEESAKSFNEHLEQVLNKK